MIVGYFKSPIGIVRVSGAPGAVVSVDIQKNVRVVQTARKTRGAVGQALRELREYFTGRRKKFSVKLAVRGTPFQKKIWRAMRRIPHGSTVSYREIARRSGRARAARAAGRAAGANRLCILIPCHRVVASAGGLGGYAHGLRRKEWLLAHERK